MTEREMLGIITRWFREDDWVFDADVDKMLVRTGITGANGQFRMYVSVRNESVVVHTMSPTNVPANLRGAIAEYLTRVNYGLTSGNFEMDFDDGEVRYKTSFVARGGHIEAWMVQHLVMLNCMMMDKYYPGMMSVIYGGATPELAVQRIEQ